MPISSDVLLLLTVLLTAIRGAKGQVLGLWFQSAAIAALTATILPWPLFLVVLLVKGILLPVLLLWLLGQMRSADPSRGSLPLFLLAGGVVLVLSGHHHLQEMPLAHPHLLLPSLALLLLGMLMVVIRRHLLGQILGLLTMENGIFLLSLAATGGMPVVIEVGTLMDLLAAGFLFNSLSRRIQEQFGHGDTDAMRRLRG